MSVYKINKDVMNEKEIRQWNNKVNQLKDYINTHFPEGCRHISPESCSRCVLINEYKGTVWNPLCELFNELAYQ